MDTTRRMGQVCGIVGALLMALTVVACEVLDPNPGPDPFNGSDLPADSTPVPEPRIDTIPPSAARGEDLFLQNCARCHGDDAAGGDLFPGSIQGKKGIHLVVREGRGGMPPFPDLSENEIESIELWLGTFDVGLENAGGEDLFIFYCAGCHGADALGAATFNGSIQGYHPIAPIVRNGLGQMPAIDITDAQIDSIQKYLQSLSVDLSTLGGVDYYAHVCASCHGSVGEGTPRGPELRNPVRGYAEWIIRNGRIGNPLFTRTMPKFDGDSLSDTQMEEILDWLAAAPKPHDGEALFNRFCSTCHGFDGRGGVVGERIDDKDLDEFFSKVREGNEGNQYSRRAEYMPSWSPSELSDDEIRRIAEWITR